MTTQDAAPPAPVAVAIITTRIEVATTIMSDGSSTTETTVETERVDMVQADPGPGRIPPPQ